MCFKKIQIIYLKKYLKTNARSRTQKEIGDGKRENLERKTHFIFNMIHNILDIDLLLLHMVICIQSNQLSHHCTWLL